MSLAMHIMSTVEEGGSMLAHGHRLARDLASENRKKGYVPFHVAHLAMAYREQAPSCLIIGQACLSKTFLQELLTTT